MRPSTAGREPVAPRRIRPAGLLLVSPCPSRSLTLALARAHSAHASPLPPHLLPAFALAFALALALAFALALSVPSLKRGLERVPRNAHDGVRSPNGARAPLPALSALSRLRVLRYGGLGRPLRALRWVVGIVPHSLRGRERRHHPGHILGARAKRRRAGVGRTALRVLVHYALHVRWSRVNTFALVCWLPFLFLSGVFTSPSPPR